MIGLEFLLSLNRAIISCCASDYYLAACAAGFFLEQGTSFNCSVFDV